MFSASSGQVRLSRDRKGNLTTASENFAAIVLGHPVSEILDGCEPLCHGIHSTTITLQVVPAPDKVINIFIPKFYSVMLF